MKALVDGTVLPGARFARQSHSRRISLAASFLCLVLIASYHLCFWKQPDAIHILNQRRKTLDRCKYIRTPAGPPPDFHSRKQSDRFVSGTKPVLLRNGKVWTGARNGTEIVYGDVLLDKGIVKAVGYIPNRVLSVVGEVHDLRGAWVTPGLVDIHSHIGVDSAPFLRGALDVNSHMSPVLPWLRSIDGLNTHDASYELAIAGGVTTAQILPGSAGNIGGQAFVIKLRSTDDRSSSSKVIEPPWTLLNGSQFGHDPPRWRYMKHACGENPSRFYDQTRMDSAWNFRRAYDKARSIMRAQDDYCAKAEAGIWDELDTSAFPDDLQWESLVDVLRGKVKLSVHCYEAVDLDGIVRLSNEFQFPVASFHHAAETYLVPDLLKKTWGGVPTVALFASNFRKKREMYRGSEFAPRILSDHNIPVVMKSDHPVQNSRYLLYEAAQAYYYGLHHALAFASVTSTPADTLGLGHRIGKIQEGYDADVVVWNSHPLALGATPNMVYIDGIRQSTPHRTSRPSAFQELPKTPDFDQEAADTVQYDGIPPLRSRKAKHVAFVNVTSAYKKTISGVVKVYDQSDDLNGQLATITVRDGAITCAFPGSACLFAAQDEGGLEEVVDLRGGSMAPGLTSFGSPLGLTEIRMEPSTNDGEVYDPLIHGVPSVLGGDRAIIRAVDGLSFGGRDSLLAYRSGVTAAITPPSGRGFLLGFSTAFSTGATHALEFGSVIQAETGLHVNIMRGLPVSVSTQVATLRRLLFHPDPDEVESESRDAWNRVRGSTMPLVVHVDNADIMAVLLRLKADYEAQFNGTIRLTFVGAAEAHLLANEIRKAGVSVVLTPSRPFPGRWDQRRILPGPPLSYESSVTALLAKNVNVAIGVEDASSARNTRFDMAWAALESGGRMSKEQAIALASTNVDRALGLEYGVSDDLVVYRDGGIFDLESKVAGVLSARRGFVEVFE